MNFKNKISELKQTIYQKLSSLIDNDYALYEIPFL